ncbi:fibronectin type III-like domain-contianing protein [Streptomyces sp. NPDC058231]|uniref:fibronectin type III-like domain-contianing protein n=1 Tax=Streptomyces sp. NPDC058231 TaxID=3346392 RepID=UPI0036EC6AE0
MISSTASTRSAWPAWTISGWEAVPACSALTSAARPIGRLTGWARVRLEPGRAARLEFTVHADRVSFVLDGPERVVGMDRVLAVPVRVTAL